MRAAQGTPTSRMTVVDEMWMYGLSIVTFDERGEVIGWWDRDRVLHVQLESSDPAVAARAKAAGFYGFGASKDEVISVQGTPSHIETVVDEMWF